MSNRKPRSKDSLQQEARRQVKEALRQLHVRLRRLDPNRIFAEPVDQSLVPDYYTVITEPMDFSTMRRKLENDEYYTVAMYQRDFVLMCKNATVYNAPSNQVHTYAKALLRDGLAMIKETQRELADVKVEVPPELRAHAQPTGTALTTKVQLTRASGSQPRTTTLPFISNHQRFARLNQDERMLRVISVQSIPIRNTVEHAYLDAIPPTEITPAPHQSFGVFVDGSKRTIDDHAAALIMEDQSPENPHAGSAGVGPAAHAQHMASILRRLSLPRESLLAELDQPIQPPSSTVPASSAAATSTAPAAPVTQMAAATMAPTTTASADPAASAIPNAAAGLLEKNRSLLDQMRHYQYERVKIMKPWEIHAPEFSVADNVRRNLLALLNTTQPSAVVAPEAIRKLLGVSVKKAPGADEKDAKSTTAAASKQGESASQAPPSAKRPQAAAAASQFSRSAALPPKKMMKMEELIGQEVVCEQCNGLGPQWLGQLWGIYTRVCYACGVYGVLYQRPRPLVLESQLEPVIPIEKVGLSKEYAALHAHDPASAVPVVASEDAPSGAPGSAANSEAAGAAQVVAGTTPASGAASYAAESAAVTGLQAAAETTTQAPGEMETDSTAQ